MASYLDDITILWTLSGFLFWQPAAILPNVHERKKSKCLWPPQRLSKCAISALFPPGGDKVKTDHVIPVIESTSTIQLVGNYSLAASLAWIVENYCISHATANISKYESDLHNTSSILEVTLRSSSLFFQAWSKATECACVFCQISFGFFQVKLVLTATSHHNPQYVMEDILAILGLAARYWVIEETSLGKYRLWLVVSSQCWQHAMG